MLNDNLGFNFHEKILNNYCRRAHEISKNEYDSERLLKLIQSETNEAHEAKTNGDNGKFKEKLADIALNLFKLCGNEGINLGEEVEKKLV